MNERPVVEGNFWIGIAWATFFSVVFFYAPVAIIAYLLWWAV